MRATAWQCLAVHAGQLGTDACGRGPHLHLHGDHAIATVVLAHTVAHDEQINGWKASGVLCGLFGVIVLIGTDALGSVGNDSVRQLAILGAAFCYAVNAIVTRQLVRVPRQSMVAALILAGSAMMVPASLLPEQPWTLTPSASASGALLALAIGPTESRSVRWRSSRVSACAVD